MVKVIPGAVKYIQCAVTNSGGLLQLVLVSTSAVTGRCTITMLSSPLHLFQMRLFIYTV